MRGLGAKLADNYVRIVRSELTGYGTSTRAEVLEEIVCNEIWRRVFSSGHLAVYSFAVTH